MNFTEFYINENSITEKILTLYHGTKPNKVNNIKRYGLKSPAGYDSASWYMLSSDFESALYHAYSDDNNGNVYVIEFEIPVTGERWKGYLYLWPEEKMNSKSSWYALKQKIPSEFIKTIHEVPYDKWIEQKNKGF